MSSINHIQNFHLNYDARVKTYTHFLMTENAKHSSVIHETSSQPGYQISLIVPPEGTGRSLLSNTFLQLYSSQNLEESYYSTKSNAQRSVHAKTETVQLQIGLVDDKVKGQLTNGNLTKGVSLVKQNSKYLRNHFSSSSNSSLIRTILIIPQKIIIFLVFDQLHTQQ